MNTRRQLVRVKAAAARRAIDDPIWASANAVLYDLCAKHPKHTDDAIIVAKLWLLGRAYAAAIERGATGQYAGDRLYTHLVTRVLKNSRIDAILQKIRVLRRPNAETVVAAHQAVVKLLRRISGHNNPSLASKHLHFHCPNAVSIYDMRAATAIRRATNRLKTPLATKNLRNPYAAFYTRCQF